jgi:hypothetical protein
MDTDAGLEHPKGLTQLQGLGLENTLVTKDSDFRAVPGLTVEDWSPQ